MSRSDNGLAEDEHWHMIQPWAVDASGIATKLIAFTCHRVFMIDETGVHELPFHATQTGVMQ